MPAPFSDCRRAAHSRQASPGLIPKSRTLQQVAAHARIAKHRKQVNVAFHTDFAIALRRCPHFGRGVVPRQRGQLVNYSVRPEPFDGSLDRSGIQYVGDGRLCANLLQRGCGTERSRKCEDRPCAVIEMRHEPLRRSASDPGGEESAQYREEARVRRGPFRRILRPSPS
jgi:hypothetical protein